MNKDLTVGNPQKILWQFCLPLFASVIFQQFYNIADSLVAGKFIGEEALAAVGNSYEITLIFLAFAFGCNIGCSVIVSLFFGGKKYDDLKTAVYTTFIASGILCLVLMVISMIFCSSLLRLINTPENVFADSKLYMDIYILGLPFVFFYNIATGVFSALGDSKTPFRFLAISSCANIFMDVLFVAAFKMGVGGVAWATFICQGVSCVLAVIVVLKRLKAIECSGKVTFFSMGILKQIAAIAIPSVLQQSSISIGNIIIQGVINSFGSGVMAGYSASVKLNNLVLTSFTTIGNGISNYTAQNLGAQKQERVKQGFFAGLKMVWIMCIPFIIVYVVCGGYVIKMFMDSPSADALSSGKLFLRIVSPFYLAISAKMVADGILRGSGMMKKFMICTFTDLILRVVLVIILSAKFGSIGIWSSWPLGWCIGTGLSMLFCIKSFAKANKDKE